MADVHAYIVPVLGTAIFKGDVATVTSQVHSYLRDHPGYTFSIRRRPKGEGDSSFAVLLFKNDGDLAFTTRLGANDNSITRTGAAELTAEILATLTNLNIHPKEHPT